LSASGPVRVWVDGQWTFNSITPMIDATLDGFGIAFVPEDSVAAHVSDGKLVQVLDGWCKPFAGFHLYYPNRRQNSPAFQIIGDAIRIRT
jgi:DNA-binding transcriptional LysR family regulator